MDAYAELSLSHEMNPSDGITIPTIPINPQTRRMIVMPILPSISLISNAIQILPYKFRSPAAAGRMLVEMSTFKRNFLYFHFEIGTIGSKENVLHSPCLNYMTDETYNRQYVAKAE